ncbi:hypothetical protein B0A55_08988 [Friedmanniomyces simplex]|uniref:Uncharacterized protein n=1 Tax=Friedmanniomyces simplex TaxID=329884 RepID=A0A4V5NFV1_9PEZI|nr:hypothetical protein B0A55_08988 [Friedmanniomyces simplex]
MGKTSAATVARDMMRSFPIRAGFMVGICGGVWSEKTDIRLGDVIVSQQDGMHGGVVQRDYGKMERDRVFRRTGTLNKPPRPLLNAVQGLKAMHLRKGSIVHQHLKDMISKYPLMEEEYGSPGREQDELFDASYDHACGDSCDKCDRGKVVKREPERKDGRPRIHYGNIASGDEAMQSGIYIRDDYLV